MHNSVLLPDVQKIIMANSDTSDKLLNMRSYPNGPIIGTIPNDHCMLLIPTLRAATGSR